MTIKSKIKKLTTLALNPKIFANKPQCLFILSHMRSRSSLLSHVLGSNEGICGYSESHNSYQSYYDLIKFKTALVQELESDFNEQYFLDKILHNRLVMTKNMLDFIEPKVIFLLREPESTIKSIINMGRKTNVDWYQDPKMATEYYCSRLMQLKEYGQWLNGGYYVLDSEQLVDNTDDILPKISQWLELKKPLVKQYKKFDKTGKIGYGDPSAEILRGEIKKTQGYPEISLPESQRQKGQQVFEQVYHYLTKNQQVLSPNQEMDLV
ncbi:sulfotransferase family protein [Thalassotalea aquiviva]|uniref:sulfotransferase family protein n=1 Tax=Thalassotalea aquiviva TaxID=3242415 RepID=UPI00352AFD9B